MLTGRVMKKALVYTLIYTTFYYFLVYEDAKNWLIDFNSLADSLITISGLIFAIIGMWVSYSYPEAVQKLTQDNENLELIESVSRARRLESLIFTILISALILLTCLIAKAIVIPVVPHVEYLENFKAEVRSIGIGAAWYLASIQSFSLISVIWINIDFLNKLYDLIRKLELHRKTTPHINRGRTTNANERDEDEESD